MERSSDGANFISIGSVAAQNVAAASYRFTDVSPVSGANYYRIRSIDVIGLTKNSVVVKVTTGSRKPMVSVYPNPVTDGKANLQMD